MPIQSDQVVFRIIPYYTSMTLADALAIDFIEAIPTDLCGKLLYWLNKIITNSDSVVIYEL